MKRRFLTVFAVVLIASTFFIHFVTAQVGENSLKSIESLQQEKVELEIRELKSKGSRWGQMAQTIPFLTTLLAVAGLLFTIYQNRSARQKELLLRDDGYIRSDMDQLLSLEVNKETAVGKVSFLFDDLNQLIARCPDRRESISNAIIRFIKEDCDFDRLRHIHIDIEALQNWGDYKEYLRSRPSELDFVIYKYIQALRHIHNEDPPYFESIQYDQQSGFKVEKYTDELRYRRFVALAKGFSLQMGQLRDGERKKTAIQQFGDAVRNPKLTTQLFGA